LAKSANADTTDIMVLASMKPAPDEECASGHNHQHEVGSAH